MSVYISEIFGNVNGTPWPDPPVTFVVIDYQNICNGAAFQLSGSTFDQQFTISNDYGSASVYAVVPVRTEEGAPVPLNTTVTLNLQFSATGPFARYKQKEHSNIGGVKFKFNVSSDSRPAQATGSALLDLPFAGGDDTNIVFGPSVDGVIARSMVGQIIVTKIKN
jgi:hypothetical protein